MDVDVKIYSVKIVKKSHFFNVKNVDKISVNYVSKMILTIKYVMTVKNINKNNK